MFSIGDKVVYPLHGAGVIEGIESKEILGEHKDYFILRLTKKDIKIMLPIDNIDDLGLRDIEDSKAEKKVYSVLSGSKSSMSDNWNRRYRENLEKVKSGDICEVATVVRDLMIMDDEKGLSTGEKKLLINTKEILISELVLINNDNWNEVERKIENSVIN